MEEIKFKTNLKCNGCISAVTPFLQEISGLGKWEVDLDGPDKILKAEVESGSVCDDILQAFGKAGYEASRI